MLFNSGAFLLFFLIVYSTYLLLRRSIRAQNLLLLVASYYFYASWDARLLLLIVFTSVISYAGALEIERTPDDTEAGRRKRKRLIVLVAAISLGILGIFKYLGFFVDSLDGLLMAFGLPSQLPTLNIILPVGISFYTFQTLSYAIDVYRGHMPATRNLVNLATYIAFFPQLVAGPIERASNLLPQFEHARKITPEKVMTGLHLILWGMFKKVVIADRVALIANQIFDNYAQFNGLDLWVGVLAFAVQIYCDFSAYSDIARGVARLMGFELMVNFRLPYFAMNPSDFWNRWHISLSSWLRDYLYITLGGNRGGSLLTYRNLFLTMLLGGLWHGAAWNFVLWGAYHGVILIAYRRFEKNPVHRDPWSGQHRIPVVLGKLVLMFTLTLIGWLFFRASSAEQIGYMLTHLLPVASASTAQLFGDVLIATLPLIVVELILYWRNNLLALAQMPSLAQVAFNSSLLLGMLLFTVRQSVDFIYFQF